MNLEGVLFFWSVFCPFSLTENSLRELCHSSLQQSENHTRQGQRTNVSPTSLNVHCAQIHLNSTAVQKPNLSRTRQKQKHLNENLNTLLRTFNMKSRTVPFPRKPGPVHADVNSLRDGMIFFSCSSKKSQHS